MDLLEMFLAEKRSEGTREGYRRDLSRFFGGDLSAATVEAFLKSPRALLAARLSAYKAEQIAAGLAEATVARRLAAVTSLIRFGHRMELCVTDGRGLVARERIHGYRDTRGIDVPQMRALLKLPNTKTPLGLRDAAMLRLMCENGLRRAEVCALGVEDFEAAGRLQVLGKGHGTQKTEVRISAAAIRALQRYQEASGHVEGALFRNARGERLSVDGLYYLVREYGDRLGIKLRPHGIRHGTITMALEATGGDVRKVQQLARHSNPATTIKYDDARRNHQSELTNLMSDLLGR